MRPDTPYDIRERTFRYAVRIVKLVNALPRTVAGVELGRQLIGAGTSVGANVEEADNAESKKDSAHKFGISRKEAGESKFWLRLIDEVDLLPQEWDTETRALIQESTELTKILRTITENIKKSEARKSKIPKPKI